MEQEAQGQLCSPGLCRQHRETEVAQAGKPGVPRTGHHSSSKLLGVAKRGDGGGSEWHGEREWTTKLSPPLGYSFCWSAFKLGVIQGAASPLCQWMECVCGSGLSGGSMKEAHTPGAAAAMAAAMAQSLMLFCSGCWQGGAL